MTDGYVPEHRGEPAEEPVIGDAPPKDNVLLSDQVYAKGKFVAQILLPAIGALYFGLAQIWGLPNAEGVVGTITVIDLFLGTILGLSSAQYKNSDARFDGKVTVLPGEHEDTSQVRVQIDPKALMAKDEITVKVAK